MSDKHKLEIEADSLPALKKALRQLGQASLENISHLAGQGGQGIGYNWHLRYPEAVNESQETGSLAFEKAMADRGRWMDSRDEIPVSAQATEATAKRMAEDLQKAVGLLPKA